MKRFRKVHRALYLLVGGMPEAVSAYLENQDLKTITLIHKSIRDNYPLDFTKYLKDEEKDKSLLSVDVLLPPIEMKSGKDAKVHRA